MNKLSVKLTKSPARGAIFGNDQITLRRFNIPRKIHYDLQENNEHCYGKMSTTPIHLIRIGLNRLFQKKNPKFYVQYHFCIPISPVKSCYVQKKEGKKLGSNPQPPDDWGPVTRLRLLGHEDSMLKSKCRPKDMRRKANPILVRFGEKILNI